jgi:ATP-dependent HslUV protease ATP-binding subunit HslU
VLILTEPENALIRQYTELMRTEGIKLTFTPDAVEAIAHMAEEVNTRTENIGARRLHTILEKLLEDISFQAPDLAEKEIHIDSGTVQNKLADVVGDTDLSRYIL